jgi:hypothetical protein
MLVSGNIFNLFPQSINCFKTSILGSDAVQFDNQYHQLVDTSCLHLQERGRWRQYVPQNFGACLQTTKSHQNLKFHVNT